MCPSPFPSAALPAAGRCWGRQGRGAGRESCQHGERRSLAFGGFRQGKVSQGGAEDFGEDEQRRGYEQPFSLCKCEVSEKEGDKVG